MRLADPLRFAGDGLTWNSFRATLTGGRRSTRLHTPELTPAAAPTNSAPVRTPNPTPLMGGSMKKLSAIITGLALAGCSAIPRSVEHDIPNFRQVAAESAIYRGGQPKSPRGWAYLRSIGISNVVKLDLEAEASDNDARALGMTVRYFPINALHQVLLMPDREAVSNAVAAIKPGTYIHCKQGVDRTGLIVGCKRVWRDGWTKTDAWNEMIADGFHPMLRGLTDFWEDAVH
jgi:protein tyrosine/serine phosphatase